MLPRLSSLLFLPMVQQCSACLEDRKSWKSLNYEACGNLRDCESVCACSSSDVLSLYSLVVLGFYKISYITVK